MMQPAGMNLASNPQQEAMAQYQSWAQTQQGSKPPPVYQQQSQATPDPQAALRQQMAAMGLSGVGMGALGGGDNNPPGNQAGAAAGMQGMSPQAAMNNAAMNHAMSAMSHLGGGQGMNPAMMQQVRVGRGRARVCVCVCV